MLQFQAGEYCICIWVTVQTFGQGTDGKAQKVLEKASEVQGVLRYEGSESKQALYVLAETVTACLDLVSALGCSEEEFQGELDMVNESNARKEY